MGKKQEIKFKKERRPFIFIVCEGRNKTEKTYFTHFKDRNAPFVLHIIDCEDTDIISMAKKANNLFAEKQLDSTLGDKVFCLVDLDLDRCKFEKYLHARERYKKVMIIPSNPCFETWLMFYFTKNPKVVSSSQKAKVEMKKFIADYTESTDVIRVAKLGMSNHVAAINNAEIKNEKYSDDILLIDKNPYTEMATLIMELVSYRKDE